MGIPLNLMHSMTFGGECQRINRPILAQKARARSTLKKPSEQDDTTDRIAIVDLPDKHP